jgi:hypothetical protein
MRYFVMGALCLLALVWVAASNIANPVNAADAEAIRLEAASNARATAQALEQKATEDAQFMIERKAVSQKVIESFGKVIDAVGIALVVLIICAAVTGGGFLVSTMLAYRKFADIRVSMVTADRNGRLPALVRIDKGHYQIVDAGTGLVLSTCEADFRNQADVAMLRNLMLMFSANVTTRNAAQSKLPGGVRASFPPPDSSNIVEVE